MKFSITTNRKEVEAGWSKASGQMPFAISVALNKTAEHAAANIRNEMPQVFDRPTPWVLNSLRVKRATKTNLVAELAYKDKNSPESQRTMIEPHVGGGQRHFKAMEARLWSVGLLPEGWNAAPGAAALLDTYGNMRKGQITTLLNVLGVNGEEGDSKTASRLAKGNKKKGTYGFAYWVNRVGNPQGKHLQPGVYQRVHTAFGSSLKPVLIFVKRAAYKRRLDFYGISKATIDKEFPGYFEKAFDEAMRTALPKTQG
jgi:hypothetical protein